jgi:hypothetical protein
MAKSTITGKTDGEGVTHSFPTKLTRYARRYAAIRRRAEPSCRPRTVIGHGGAFKPYLHERFNNATLTPRG